MAFVHEGVETQENQLSESMSVVCWLQGGPRSTASTHFHRPISSLSQLTHTLKARDSLESSKDLDSFAKCGSSIYPHSINIRDSTLTITRIMSLKTLYATLEEGEPRLSALHDMI
jgi:hypothetical protein